jgi:hypothetical protein
MPREKSQNQTNGELSSQLYLLQEAAIGHLDSLECPNCRHKVEQGPNNVDFKSPAIYSVPQ